jgi:hypothetical protein
VTDVAGLCIWGNHSATQYPDIAEATVAGKAAGTLVDDAWYKDSFIPDVQQRGAAIIKARGASSAASAANAAIDHMHDWALGSQGIVSMAVYSDGSYGVQKGLIYSFPVICRNGDWEIVQGRQISEFSREKMRATEAELIEERDAVAHLLPGHQHAVFHHQDAVGLLSDALVVGHQHHGTPCSRQFVEQGEHLLARGAVERSGRLICQDEPGLVDQRPGDSGPLLLTSRHLLGQLVEVLTQPNRFRRFPDTV